MAKVAASRKKAVRKKTSKRKKATKKKVTRSTAKKTAAINKRKKKVASKKKVVKKKPPPKPIHPEPQKAETPELPPSESEDSGLVPAEPETREEAIERLQTIAKAAQKSDPSVAIQAQKELNKLQNYYPGKDEKGSGSDKANEELAGKIKLIESYVLPLKLISNDYPIEEHVRVCCEKVREIEYEKR